jgi:tetratricopeptide (TPR) repeat protein
MKQLRKEEQAPSRMQAANQLAARGLLSEAETIYRDLIANHEGTYLTFANLAAVCGKTKRESEGIELLQMALLHKPDFFEGWLSLGSALLQAGENQAALNAFQKALRTGSNSPELMFQLGRHLRQQGDLTNAATAYQRAAELKPDQPEAYYNLGNLYDDCGKYRQAIESFQKAIALKSDFIPALSNLALTYKRSGKIDMALKYFTRALELEPGTPEIRWNLGITLLLNEDYEEGWAQYESRFLASDPVQLDALPTGSLWDGNVSTIAGEQILLVSEQGLGDSLQFIRYADYLRRLGLKVLLCAPTKLHSIIRSSGLVAELYSPAEIASLAPCKWIALLSVPRVLGVTPKRPLITGPYIHPSKERVVHWKERLRNGTEPIVGINWQGNPASEQIDLKGRSLSLSLFAPLVFNTNVSLVSLQKGPGSEQLEECGFRDRFVSCQGEVDKAWDFEDAAAIIANCDLVISCDTAVAHLAGAMGARTWLLLHKVPDWRWGLHGRTTFWYPSVRLFRQQQSEHWDKLASPEVV